MNMVTGVLVWVILVSLIVLVMDRLKARRASRKGGNEGENLPYILKGKLFTPAEVSFYRVLKSAVGHQYAIFGQVRVADVLSVQKNLSKSDRQKHFNWISAKHIDFILCDPETLHVMCAIELDDSSHAQEKRARRDDFLNKAFQAAGLPLVRHKTKQTYIEADIIEELRPFIDLQESIPAPARSEESPSVSEKACPHCDANMVRKKALKGPHEGEEFWVCTHFPTCKTTIPVTRATA